MSVTTIIKRMPTDHAPRIGTATTIAAPTGLVVGAQFSLEAACAGYDMDLSLTFIPKAIADCATKATHTSPLERIAS